MTRDEAAGVLIARVLADEGGVGQVPGETWTTYWGQTPRWLATFGFPTPTSADEAAANYRTWLNRTGLIGLCDYPDPFAQAVIDWAVNSGHPVAIRALQRRVGATVDGIYGPETQAAVDRVDRRRAAAGVVADRLRFLGRIVTDDPAQHARNMAGWANRVALQIEALT